MRDWTPHDKILWFHQSNIYVYANVVLLLLYFIQIGFSLSDWKFIRKRQERNEFFESIWTFDRSPFSSFIYMMILRGAYVHLLHKIKYRISIIIIIRVRPRHSHIIQFNSFFAQWNFLIVRFRFLILVWKLSIVQWN